MAHPPVTPRLADFRAAKRQRARHIVTEMCRRNRVTPLSGTDLDTLDRHVFHAGITIDELREVERQMEAECSLIHKSRTPEEEARFKASQVFLYEFIAEKPAAPQDQDNAKT